MLITLHYNLVRLAWLDLDVDLNFIPNVFNVCVGSINGARVAVHTPKRQQLE